MEKKYLGGRLDRKTTFGLIWLLYAIPCVSGIGWILALVVLLMDKDSLDVEDKREIVSCFVCVVAGLVLSWTFVVPAYVWICSIIACVKAFKGETFQIPGAYHIANAIIK